MPAKLILLGGDSPTEFPLVRENKVGRHPENEVQVLDRIVSKEHATIVQDERNQYRILDQGSLNGTYVNGKRINTALLRDGDTITMGSTSFRFQDEHQRTRLRRVSARHRPPRRAQIQRGPGPREGSGRFKHVTLANNHQQSHIRSRLEDPFQFLPADQIKDPDALAADYEKLRVAHELSRSLAIHTNLDRLLQRIVDEALKLIDAERAVILFYSTQGDWIPRYTRQQNSQSEIRLSTSILDEVQKSKRAVLSSDASCDERFKSSRSVIMEGIRSTMCVPLIANENFIGAFHVDSTLARSVFTEKDLQIFSGIANQAAFAIANYRMAKKIEQEAQTRARFERLVSPNLVDQIVDGEVQLEQGGQLKKVAMLFVDIRGFTAMSESHEAQEMVQTLNSYYEAMVQVLFEHEGTLDKYVGDQLIGLFGAPVPMAQASNQAVSCALAMIERLRSFNKERLQNNQVAIEVGIGINTGMVVAGAIGSPQTLQYTVIGDPVNVAARLCSAAAPGEILISEPTKQDCDESLLTQACPPIAVKGKSNKIEIYRVTGKQSPVKIAS